MKYLLEYIAFQSLKWLILLLPLKSAQRLGRFLGLVAFYILRSRRRITQENLKHAFKEKTADERDRIAKKAFQNYGITIAELLWIPNFDGKTLSNLVRINNLDLMIEKYREGKGLVMLTGHCGNWELLALGVGYMSGIPLTIIVQTQNNKMVDFVINRHRCRYGNRVIPMGISIREVIRTLSNGGIVAIASDQSGARDGIYVEFFGRRVATHQGPAVFSLRSGAPLIMVYMVRQQNGTYDAYLEEVQKNDLTGYSEENVLELTRRHTKMLENHIRQYPDHWLWMHRRWKHVIPDEKINNKVV